MRDRNRYPESMDDVGTGTITDAVWSRISLRCVLLESQFVRRLLVLRGGFCAVDRLRDRIFEGCVALPGVERE